jgi:ABC-type Fe3+ transport system permease subunit
LSDPLLYLTGVSYSRSVEDEAEGKEAAMSEERGEPTTRARKYSPTIRPLGVITIVFWASVALMAVLVILSMVVPGLREVWSFNLLGSTCAVLAMVSSAFLFWRERRVNRQQMRALRRESRDIPREDDNEWTAKELLYAAVFVISFLFVWYLLPNVLLTS